MKCLLPNSQNNMWRKSTFTMIGLELVFLPLLVLVLVVNSQEPACCDQASGVCASACKQLSLVALASESDLESRDRQLRSVQVLCPTQLVSFWQCMNETLTALHDAASWQGRVCCSLAQTRICQISCLTAQETNDLASGCRLSDESPVYQCLDKQEEYDTCCAQSRKPECSDICKTFVREQPKSNRKQGLRKRFNMICEREPTVLACALNLTQTSTVHNTERYLPCCSKGRHGECQEACRRALRTATSDQAIMDIVEKGCGHPRPDDKMWQCFLQNSEPRGTELPSKIDRLGMDAAKLHCCHRASSTTCRRLCYKTYSREWTGSWSDLDSVCLSSPNELSLRSCVDEVEESCELGCDGLSFCSAFNNRHADLFRRCNPAADLAARQQFEQWKALSYIPLSETMHLPLKDLGQCATEKWKTVACALQLKPCHRKTHVSQICRSDCVSLLHECVDFDSFPAGGHDVSSICELLSPPPGEPCIALSTYSQKLQTRAGSRISEEKQVSRPCQNRPCNATESCSVNRECTGSTGEDCSEYTCAKGCSLGEVSRVIVGPGTWIRVPTQTQGCHRLCRCSTDGRMEQCASSVCEPNNVCWLGRNRIEHGSHFWLDCNLCSCRSGELICSKRECLNKEANPPSETNVNYPRLPCNCPPIPSPVCGVNGKTYASSCLAKCAGLSDNEIAPESCADKDPCEGVFCGNGRRCIANRRICLAPVGKKCQQFQCVPLKCEESWMKSKQPVCDTQNNQHSNLCSLANTGALLAYRGTCYEKECSTQGKVCGVDGETYVNECAAKSQGISKDYDGPCRYVGMSDGSSLQPACSRVICPKLPQHCVGATPPGACCPICGGILLVIYSPSQVLKLADASDTQLITTEDLSKRLNSLVQTAQCQVGVYLGLETELVILVTPVSQFWTKPQLQACVSEADRLSTIITQQNPIILVDMALSTLTASFVYHIASGSPLALISSPSLIISILALIFVLKLLIHDTNS